MTTKYDYIDGSSGDDENEYSFYTIGELISVCGFYPNAEVRFVGVDATVGNLGSWRGSYDLPAISPLYGEVKTGKQVAEQLIKELEETHCGWKGGDYKYHHAEEFYVAERGCSSEYKVIGYEINNQELILLTKIDPY